MLISGIPEIASAALAPATFEGENYVMWQQVAKYLIKNMKGQELPEGLQYLKRYCVNAKCPARGNAFLDRQVALKIFEHRAARLILEVEAALSSSKLSEAEAWNKYMM